MVRRIGITSIDEAAFEGARFGEVGAYTLVKGRACCELDPLHPLNRDIALLDRAPRNARGWVEYDMDLCVLRPTDPARANGWLLFEVPNRGNKLMVGRLNKVVAANDLARRRDAGDGLAMRLGFTMAWCGWQADAPAGRLLARLPIAAGVTGRSREEFIAEPNLANDRIESMTDTRFVARPGYPAATLDVSQATLTVRQNERDPRAQPAGLAWRFLDAQRIEVTRAPGMDSGAIYEFCYTARDPVVAGIGYAAMRDFVEFLRHDDADAEGNANPLGDIRPRLRHSMAFGASQSARVLRDFLHQGFNLGGRGVGSGAVFDAMLPVVSGARRAFVNAPFAQPGRFSRQHEDHDFPGDQFPFAYATSHDAISGRTDGLLARAEADGVVPKILHLDSDTELWAGRASLVVTDTAGRDLPQPPNVRVYLASGIPHATNPPPPGLGACTPNMLAYCNPLRALLVALVDCVEHGSPPPPSTFPSRSRGTLVALEAARARWPAIPNGALPARMNELRLLGHATVPPKEGAAYPVFVAATDGDGNALDGIRDPLVEAPVATLSGWMPRAEGYAPGELYGLCGAAFAFAPDAAARELAGDPRPSLEERYGTPQAWAGALQAAAQALVRQRLLLPEDAQWFTDRAQRGWALPHFYLYQ